MNVVPLRPPSRTPPAPEAVAALCAADRGLLGDLRSDHAGETGAVMIYRGILAVTRNPAIRHFAQAHLATEQLHLDLMNHLLPAGGRSILLPIWRVAGFLTGALPALLGPRAVYATIDAVETFVDHHYAEQITRLAGNPQATKLRATLLACQADEVAHRDEAREAAPTPPGRLLQAWMALVGAGSQAAVAAARRI